MGPAKTPCVEDSVDSNGMLDMDLPTILLEVAKGHALKGDSPLRALPTEIVGGILASSVGDLWTQERSRAGLLTPPSSPRSFRREPPPLLRAPREAKKMVKRSNAVLPIPRAYTLAPTQQPPAAGRTGMSQRLSESNFPCTPFCAFHSSRPIAF